MQYFVCKNDLQFFGNSKLQKIIYCTEGLDSTCLSTVLNRFEIVTYIDFLKFFQILYLNFNF